MPTAVHAPIASRISRNAESASWLFTKMLCYLTHLEVTGAARRIAGEPERWSLV